MFTEEFRDDDAKDQDAASDSSSNSSPIDSSSSDDDGTDSSPSDDSQDDKKQQEKQGVRPEVKMLVEWKMNNSDIDALMAGSFPGFAGSQFGVSKPLGFPSARLLMQPKAAKETAHELMVKQAEKKTEELLRLADTGQSQAATSKPPPVKKFPWSPEPKFAKGSSTGTLPPAAPIAQAPSTGQLQHLPEIPKAASDGPFIPIPAPVTPTRLTDLPKTSSEQAVLAEKKWEFGWDDETMLCWRRSASSAGKKGAREIAVAIEKPLEDNMGPIAVFADGVVWSIHHMTWLDYSLRLQGKKMQLKAGKAKSSSQVDAAAVDSDEAKTGEKETQGADAKTGEKEVQGAEAKTDEKQTKGAKSKKTGEKEETKGAECKTTEDIGSFRIQVKKQKGRNSICVLMKKEGMKFQQKGQIVITENRPDWLCMKVLRQIATELEEGKLDLSDFGQRLYGFFKHNLNKSCKINYQNHSTNCQK